MTKFNWNKFNQQNIVYKKEYENVSNKIYVYKQCNEKQYQLIKKLILENKHQLQHS